MTITIKIDETAKPGIRAALALQGERGYKIAAIAISEAVKAHFVAKDQQPNKRGWPKQHFFDKARQQTHWTAGRGYAEVAVSLVGFGTHFLGKPEVIRPVNKKALTIPARPEAYGRRAGEFSDLVFRIVADENGRFRAALVQAEQTAFKFGRQRKDGTRGVKDVTQLGGDVYFWLVRSVRPQPHPDAFPTDEALQLAVIEELNAIEL